MASLATVAIYHDLSEAVAARSCLRAYGLVAILPEWHHASLAWHHVHALHGLRLCTLDSMAADARKLLGFSDTARRQEAAVQPRSGYVRSDITFNEWLIAAAAYLLTGLPCPVWYKRQRSEETHRGS